MPHHGKDCVAPDMCTESHVMPHQNLPKELQDEIDLIKSIKVSLHSGEDPVMGETMEALIKHQRISVLWKFYEAGKAAGYKEGILGAIDMMPSEIHMTTSRSGWGHPDGWRDYRSALLSRLEERMKNL